MWTAHAVSIEMFVNNQHVNDATIKMSTKIPTCWNALCALEIMQIHTTRRPLHINYVKLYVGIAVTVHD